AVQSERDLTDPASYIYRIAVTTTIDAVRRVMARREEQLLLEPGVDTQDAVISLEAPSEESPDRIAERRQVMQKVEAAIAHLTENRRTAVELHLQGMTSQEIADLMDWSEPKARNLVYRGLNDLRERLREEGIDYE
ncbi:MAG TPA: RNA polymerase sigma factor, partial [Blastocatellia bacterium]|nr:RNA polymerase sigma factor [Blastocatellia bacterium]